MKKFRIQNYKIRNKNKYKYRYRRNNPFSSMTVPLSTRPCSFGPGVHYLNVSKLVKGSLSTEVDLNFYYDIIYENPEFLRLKDDFKYFRLVGLSVVFLPRNLPTETNQTPAYLLVNYDGLPTQNFRLQDSVKIVPAYLPYHKIYKFKIPNISASTGSLRNWRNANEINDWNVILIQLQAPDNTADWYFRVEGRIELKGPTNKISTKDVEINTAMLINKNEELAPNLSKSINKEEEENNTEAILGECSN